MILSSSVTRILRRMAFAGFLLTNVASASQAEDELRAATVLSFLRYSQWPEPLAGPLIVAVAGRRSFADVLIRMLDRKSVNNRQVRVVDLRTADSHCCQLVYIATANAAEINQALLHPRSAQALTIGETDHFLDYGGAVNLFLADGRIGFDVNLENLERSRVTVSATLLRYGHIKRRVAE